MFDPFAPQAPPARERQLAAYLAYLEARDGEPDLEARTLSARDAFFAELDANPLQSAWRPDADQFARSLAGEVIPDLDERLLWLLVAGKANRAERYGVDRVLERGRKVRRPHDVYVPLEEVYHTRVLLDACRLFGLDLDLLPPPTAARTVIHLMEGLPDSLSVPLILAGEVTGSALFQLLLDRVELFDDESAIAARLRTLLRAILVDELGHVAYCRARLGPAALWSSLRLLPVVAGAVMRDIPELPMLAGGRERFLARVRAFDVTGDPVVDRLAFSPDDVSA